MHAHYLDPMKMKLKLTCFRRLHRMCHMNIKYLRCWHNGIYQAVMLLVSESWGILCMTIMNILKHVHTHLRNAQHLVGCVILNHACGHKCTASKLSLHHININQKHTPIGQTALDHHKTRWPSNHIRHSEPLATCSPCSLYQPDCCSQSQTETPTLDSSHRKVIGAWRLQKRHQAAWCLFYCTSTLAIPHKMPGQGSPAHTPSSQGQADVRTPRDRETPLCSWL